MPLSVGAGTALAGGIGALGSVISGGMSKRAAKAYNKGQKEIAQMNNEWNAAEAQKNRDWQSAQTDKQNAWNLEQWNRENAYNTASAQRQRLEDAGLNPYLMMNGGSAGEAGSVASASIGSGAQAQAVQPNQVPAPFQVDFSSISDAINAYFSNKKLTSETVGQNTQNTFDMQFGPDFRRAQIAGLVNGRMEWLTDGYGNTRKRNAESLAQLGISKEFQEYRNMRASMELAFAQASQTYLSAEGQRLSNKYIDQQNQADLATKAAQAFSNYASGKASLESVRTQIAQQALISAQASGQRISNKQAEDLSQDYINAMRQEYLYNSAFYRGMKQYGDAIGNSFGKAQYLENLNKARNFDIDSSEPSVIRYLRRHVSNFTKSFLGRD